MSSRTVWTSEPPLEARSTESAAPDAGAAGVSPPAGSFAVRSEAAVRERDLDAAPGQAEQVRIEELELRIYRVLDLALARERPLPQPAPVSFSVAFSLFLSELRRRRVYRTAAAYLAGGLVLLDALNDVLPTLGASPAVFHGVVVLVLAGFPVGLLVSWVFDLKGGELRRTQDLPAHGGVVLWERVVFAVIAALSSILLAVALALWIL